MYLDVTADLSPRLANFGGLSQSTVPTEQQAAQIAESVSARVDMRLVSLGGTVPVTQPEWLLRWARSAEIAGTMAEILRVRFGSQTRAAGDTGPWVFYATQFDAAMSSLEKINLTVTAGGAKPSGYWTLNDDPGPQVTTRTVW